MPFEKRLQIVQFFSREMDILSKSAAKHAVDFAFFCLERAFWQKSPV